MAGSAFRDLLEVLVVGVLLALAVVGVGGPFWLVLVLPAVVLVISGIILLVNLLVARSGRPPW